MERTPKTQLGIEPIWPCTPEMAQNLVDEAPAEQYYSDKFPLYDSWSIIAVITYPSLTRAKFTLWKVRCECVITLLSHPAGAQEPLLFTEFGLVEPSC